MFDLSLHWLDVQPFRPVSASCTLDCWKAALSGLHWMFVEPDSACQRLPHGLKLVSPAQHSAPAGLPQGHQRGHPSLPSQWKKCADCCSADYCRVGHQTEAARVLSPCCSNSPFCASCVLPCRSRMEPGAPKLSSELAPITTFIKLTCTTSPCRRRRTWPGVARHGEACLARQPHPVVPQGCRAPPLAVQPPRGRCSSRTPSRLARPGGRPHR